MTTQSRALNKKSFAMASQGAGAPDIEMPPLDETPTIQTAAPNPWDNQQEQPAAPKNVQANPHFPVPDTLPEEVEQAMAEDQYEDQEDDQEEPVVDIVSTTSDRDKVSQTQKQDPKDSFRAVREAKERAEYERDLLLKQMYELQAQMNQKQVIQQQEEPEIDFDIDEDALVEGKHVKKMQKQFKKLEQTLKQQQEINAATVMETKIRADFPDIDVVISPENIQKLNTEYPEIARSLKSHNNMYDQAAAAYKIMKGLGIYKDKVFANDRAKAISNVQKPRPLSSVSPQQGDSPLSRANAFANGLTEDVKEQLRKEMYAARKSI